jgi:predicted nucleic acid-binding protein
VVRRKVLLGELTISRGREALAVLGELPLQRHGHTALLGRVFELRDNAIAYDPIYLALAEALGAPLVTRVRRLATVPGVRADGEVVG